jgi:hypothetical protein
MRKLVLILFLACGTAWGATPFDENGVWRAVDTYSLAKGKTIGFGPQTMTQRDGKICVLVYGRTGGDSLKVTVILYGMMGYSLADTLHMTPIQTKTVATTGKTVVLADTLEGAKSFPFLYGKVKNNHPDSTATIDVYLYSLPRDNSVTMVR